MINTINNFILKKLYELSGKIYFPLLSLLSHEKDSEEKQD